MAQLLCEGISEGRWFSEIVATISDVNGRLQQLTTQRDCFSQHPDGSWYIEVEIIHEDDEEQAILVELTCDAEMEKKRLWVKREKLTFVDPESTIQKYLHFGVPIGAIR